MASVKYKSSYMQTIKLRFFRILLNSFQKFSKSVGGQEATSGFQYFKEEFHSDVKASHLMEVGLEKHLNKKKKHANKKNDHALETYASNGIWTKPAPLGYKKIEQMLLPSDEAKIVQRIFELRASRRLSVNKISEQLKFEQAVDLPNYKVKSILTNPVYIGKVERLGNLYQGTHQPIISESTFKAAQKICIPKFTLRGESESNDLSLVNFVVINGVKDSTLSGRYQSSDHGSPGRYFYTYFSTKSGVSVHKLKVFVDKNFSNFLESYLEHNPMILDSTKLVEYYRSIHDDVLSLILKEILITQAQLDRFKSHSEGPSAASRIYSARLADFFMYRNIAIEFRDESELSSYSKAVMNSLSSWRCMPDNVQSEIQQIVFPEGVSLDSQEFIFSTN